jgi:hypothetical protein
MTSTFPSKTIFTPQQILIHQRKKATQERIIFCLNFLSIKIQAGKVKDMTIKEIPKTT